MFKTYLSLTKPGIIIGNALPAVGAFFLASVNNSVSVGHFLGMLSGLSLVIASACVANNYLDRDIDNHMARTKQRAMVLGHVTPRVAVIFSGALIFAGLVILGLFTNQLTVLIAAFGWVAYVVIYGYAKRRSHWGTVIGSISGAIPPVVGYTAVSNSLDTAAVLLFLVLVCWQMPHFYAIAIYRLKDYKAAKIPVLPAVKSMLTTKIRIMLYIAAFTAVSLQLSAFGYTGTTYFGIMLMVGFLWFRASIGAFRIADSEAWAKRVFKASLVVMTVFSLMLAVGGRLP